VAKIVELTGEFRARTLIRNLLTTTVLRVITVARREMSIG